MNETPVTGAGFRTPANSELRAPTLAEIARHFGFRSLTTVADLSLYRKGGQSWVAWAASAP